MYSVYGVTDIQSLFSRGIPLAVLSKPVSLTALNDAHNEQQYRIAFCARVGLIYAARGVTVCTATLSPLKVFQL